MRYTIITPTLLRDTLPRLCESIDRQTCSDWQHILAVDEWTVHSSSTEKMTSFFTSSKARYRP